MRIRLPKIKAPKIRIDSRTLPNLVKNSPIGRTAEAARVTGITQGNMIDNVAKSMGPQELPPLDMSTGMPSNVPLQGDLGIGTRGLQAQVGYDAAGRPIRNNYQSVLDEQGKIRSNFALAGRIGPDVQVNTAAADAMRARATAQGPSTWARLAEENQRLEQSQALGEQNRMNMANQNRAFNSLAQRGGLSAGQRERLAAQGMNQGLRGQQQIMGQGMQQRLGIGMQDEQMKNQMLGQSAAADLNLANFNQAQRAFNTQAQQFDINNALNDVRGLNAYNSGAFTEAMREWGSAKTADAQARASRGGGKK